MTDAPSLPALPTVGTFAALLSDLRRSARRLTRTAEDADDLVQETLLRVWARMAMARDGASDAAPVTDLRGYAFATLRNRAIARGVPRPASGVTGDLVAPSESDARTRMACAEALEALAQLPQDQQRLLRMRAMEGMSYAEIAQATGLPLGTVTSRLARGRAAMRVALDLPSDAPVSDLLGGG